MRVIKKIVYIIVVAFVVIQFIRPARNNSVQLLPGDISKLVAVPDQVQAVLKNACYDCHSNNTSYPWYADIQPMAWLMAKHIRQGKTALNFSEFGTYTTRRRLSKLTGIANSVRDDDMPLASFKWMHKNARLSVEEKTLIIDWVQRSKDSLLSKNKHSNE